MHTFTQTDSLFTVRPSITDTHTHSQQNMSTGILSQLKRHNQGRDRHHYSYVKGTRAVTNLVGNWILLLFANG